MTVLAWFVAAALAAASSAAGASRADPADPRAGTPVRFDSGLRAAKSPSEADPAARWREHNDRVRAIGGHAGSLRNATPQQSETAAGDAKAGKR